VKRLVDWLTRLAIHHWRATLLVTIVVTITGAIATTQLRLDPAVVSFLPAHNRAVIDFRRTLEALGTTDQHFVLVELPHGADASTYESVIDDLASRYERSPLVESVDARVPDPRELVEHLLPYATLMLRRDEVDALAKLLTDDAIRESMARNRMLLSTPQSSVAKSIVPLDPLGLRTIFLSRLGGGVSNVKLDLASGYLLSADHTAFLLIVHPKFAAHDVASTHAFMQDVARIDAEALAAFRTAHPEAAAPRISEAGAYAINEEDAQLIRGDMVLNVIISVAGVLALFLFAFRRGAAILYAVGPMAAAIVSTFGLAALTVRSLSAASAGFAALLAGLGIDFITVLYQRFTEERNRDASVEDAIRTTMRTTMPGVAAASLTTAATFYAFLVTDFRGMAQMGFLTGTGILFFFLAVAFVLPALIVWRERGKDRPPRIQLHAFGTQRLMRACIARPHTTIVVWCAITMISIVIATQVEFNDDAARLRPSGTAAVAAQMRAGKIFGRHANVGLLVADGKTADEALQRSETVLPLLDRLAAERRIGGFDSLAGLVPTIATQSEALARMRELPPAAFDAERVAKSIAASAEANGLKPAAFEEFSDALRTALGTREPVDIGAIQDPMLTKLSTRFVQEHRGVWYVVSYVYPPEGGWSNKTPPELMRLSESTPHVVFTGPNIVSAALREVARFDAIRSTLLGLALVFVLFAFAFRSLGYAALSFIPFIAGAAGMLAIMAMLGLELNLINIFAGLMIVGVATDYAVYMLQRYRENPAVFAGAAIETGQAVAMAALTTIAGYGSFAVSHYPGLRSVGYITTLGIGVSALAALTLLPAILVLKTRRS